LKFVKLLLLISFIIFAYGRKVKTNMKSTSGEPSGAFTWYVYINNSGDYSTCKVDTKDIKTTGLPDNRKGGLTITCSDAKADLKKYFTADGSYYVLPYRQCSNFRFTNPSWEGKYIDVS